MSRLTLAFRLFLLVGGLIAFHTLVIDPWRCNRALDSVKRNSLAAMSERSTTTATAMLMRNLAVLDRHESGCCLKVDFHLMRAANDVMLQNHERALTAYRAALKIDHRPEIYFDLGSTLLELGRPEEAIPHLIHAVRFNPYMIDHLSGEARERVAAGAGLK